MTGRLAFDAAVPFRDQLLDFAAMRDRLAATLQIDIRTLRPARVKYRPGVDLRVAYRTGRGDSEIVTMRTGCRDGRASHRSGAVVPDLDATFWRFPHDRRLPALNDMLRPVPALAANVGGWVHSRIAGYAPEKNLVVACLAADGVVLAYAKMYAPDENGSRLFALHTAIAASAAAAGLRVPIAIAFDAARQVALTTAMPGTRLADAPDASLIRSVRSLGTAIARFHGLRLPATVSTRTKDVPRDLLAAVEVLGRVRPTLRPAAAQLTSRLMASTPAPVCPSLLHGDVHFKNAVADGDSLSLIDLDQACTGPAASDIGSFLSSLRAQAACRLLPEDRAAALAGAFLDGYAASAPLPDVTALRWHTAASMLAERTVRAVTRMRTAMLPHLGRMLDSARDALEEIVQS